MSFLRISFSSNKVKRRSYDPRLLKAAFDDVIKNKTSVHKAAKMFGVPESTLRDRTLGLQPVPDAQEGFFSNPGPVPTFSKAEEKELIQHMGHMSSIGYGYSKQEFLRLATDFAISLQRKTESDPTFGESWYKTFKKRNSDLTLAKPQKLAVVRAKATSEEVLNKYFKELEQIVKENGLSDKPENIWNLDETGISMEHSPSNIVCVKGTKPQAITSTRGKNVTIIAGGNATGSRIPPFYIFPGKRWNPDLLEDAIPGSKGTVTESGWSNSTVFLEYMEEHFLRHVPTDKSPVLVLLDGHRSHVNLTLREWGKTHNIVFFLLPPHTSHVTQPLDVGCFGPLKRAYYSECQSFLRSIPGQQISRYNVAKLSGKAYNKGLTPENLISAFKKAGIFPLQRTAISTEKTTPSKIYRESNNTENQSSAFLDSRKITKTTDNNLKRKHQPITGNLMSPSKDTLLKKIPNDLKKSKKNCMSKKPSKTPEPKPSTSSEAPKPCTSGAKSKTVTSVLLFSDSDTDDETSEEELCCVCKKVTPDAMDLMYTIDIANWAQCDICHHWTHLKYCSKVRVLRRGDIFHCPHCENM